jgi:hypothetical protein
MPKYYLELQLRETPKLNKRAMDVLDKNTVEMPKTARAHPLTEDGVDEEFSNGCNFLSILN